MHDEYDKETRLAKARAKADHYLGAFQFILEPDKEKAKSFGILANLDEATRHKFFQLPEGQTEAVLSALVADFRRVEYWVGRVQFAEAAVVVPARVFDQLTDWSGISDNAVAVSKRAVGVVEAT